MTMTHHVRVAVVRSRYAASGLSGRRLLLTSLLLIALAAIAYVRQASLVAAAGYDLQELQEIRQRRLAAVEQLRLKIAEARALDRVAREAEQRGLLPAEDIVYLRLSMGPQPVISGALRPSSPDAAQSSDDTGHAPRHGQP